VTAIKLSDRYGVATIKIGPIKARWKGKVRFSDLDPPNSYRISGEGEVAGFAKGSAKVSLAEKDDGTLLSYKVEAQIGGKIGFSPVASSMERNAPLAR
jgi:carbon monoxide dehydrogenase subunit G